MSSPSAGGSARPASVSAVVVNWNSAALLARCLDALYENGRGSWLREVVVVDNGSGDGSAAMVRTDWPQVALVENDRNLGFMRASNQGIRAARGEHLLLVNADAFVRPGAIERLVDWLADNPRAGAVAPRLEYGDGRWQRWTAGREPSLASAARFFLFLDRLLPASTPKSLYLERDVRSPFRPDWVSSACMLVRRAALDDVGLLDETYFCYMDDVDLCRRLRGAEWDVWYVPDAVVTHLMGGTDDRSRQASPAAIRNFNDYFERRRGPWAAAVLRAIEVVGFGARAAAYGAMSLASRADGHRGAAFAHIRNARTSLVRGPV